MAKYRWVRCRNRSGRVVGCPGFARNERGDVAISFALMAVILIFFLGLALDMSMVLMDRNRTDGLCQVIGESRFTHRDSVRFSANPAQATVDYVTGVLRANGFEGTAVIAFEESPRHVNHRHISVCVTLYKESPFYFLRLFGANGVTTSSAITFEDDYGEGGNDVIWAPSAAVSSYNGTYEVTLQ